MNRVFLSLLLLQFSLPSFAVFIDDVQKNQVQSAEQQTEIKSNSSQSKNDENSVNIDEKNLDVQSKTNQSEQYYSNNTEQPPQSTHYVQRTVEQDNSTSSNTSNGYSPSNDNDNTTTYTQTTNKGGDFKDMGIFLLVLFLIFLYLLPTIVAFNRAHRSRWMVMIVNCAFGFTFLGWIFALIWAMNKIDDPIKGGTKHDPQPHDPLI